MPEEDRGEKLVKQVLSIIDCGHEDMPTILKIIRDNWQNKRQMLIALIELLDKKMQHGGYRVHKLDIARINGELGFTIRGAVTEGQCIEAYMTALTEVQSFTNR